MSDLDEDDIDRQLAELEGVELSDEDLDDLEEEVKESQKNTQTKKEEPKAERNLSELASVINHELDELASGSTPSELLEKFKNKYEEELEENTQLHDTFDFICQKFADLKKNILEGKSFGEAASLQQRLYNVQLIFDEQEKENMNMDKVLQKLQEEQNDLKIKYGNLYQSDKDVTELQTQFISSSDDKLNSLITSFATLCANFEKDNAEQAEKNESLQNANNKLKSRLPILENEVEELLEIKSKNEAEIEVQNEEIKKEYENHFAKMEELQIKLHNTKTETIDKRQISTDRQTTIENLQRNLREVTKKNSNLKEEFEESERNENKIERDIARMKNQIEKFESENGELYKEIRALEKEKRKPRVNVNL